MGDPVVQTINLVKRYGEFTALDSLSIELEQGRILGFIGPNGAGKTTTIKILVGLSVPTSGEARIAGFDCTRDAHQIKKVVGFMPDEVASYDNMRVREYLDFFGAAFRIPRSERGKRLDEVMEITGSTYMKDLYVQSLSHGMKKRVGIARTLLHDPKVLIFDEPASGLDPQARIAIRDLMLQLAERGKTLIVTSHILPELSRICDTVAIITHGKLRAFGELDQIMRDVRQKRIFEVQLLSHGETVAKAAAVIGEHLGDGSEVTPSDAEAMVRFSTVADDESLAALLTKLASNGVGLAQFREVPVDLEDAFLEVTGHNDKQVHSH